MFGNYHTHCTYCDGSGEPEDYVKAAINGGLSSYGFSSHAPLGSYSCSLMASDQLETYIQEIKRLKKRYETDISILVGLEIDFIPGVMGPHSERFQALELDYTVGSIHYVDFFVNGQPLGIDRTTTLFQKGLKEVFADDFQKLCRRYFALIRQMVEEQPPDIVAHIDKVCRHNQGNRYFIEEDLWYQKEITHTLHTIKNSNSIIELNTRGLYTGSPPRPYPSLSVLKQIKQMELPIMINTDAHKPEQIKQGYRRALKMIKQIGFRSLHVFNRGKIQKINI